MTDNTGGVLAGDHRDHRGPARRASDPSEPRFHLFPWPVVAGLSSSRTSEFQTGGT